MSDIIDLSAHRVSGPAASMPPGHDAEVQVLPYSVSRRIHSRKPRRSKNGTPEERAAAASRETRPTSIEGVRGDRRKLRGSPLREKATPVSFAVTIAGKIYTAGLRGDPLPDDMAGLVDRSADRGRGSPAHRR